MNKKIDSAAARRRTLRTLVDRRDALIVPGAANGLTARIIQSSGFEACYVSGAGIANTHLGVPDIGLVSLKEVQDTVAAIDEVCGLPLVVDIDTGFGNALNTRRAVQVLERAGASALQIEDQVFPKKCGHFSGKAVIATEEMITKIKAAVDARQDENLLIIARTDARAIEGLGAAIERASAYSDAGADMTFVEAPVSLEEMRSITEQLSVPQVANLVVGGKTPMVPRETLAELGFGMVLYANAALQAAMLAMQDVMRALHRDGSLDAVKERLIGFEQRQQIVDKDTFDALEQRYRVE